MQDIKISLITVCYNAENTVKRCIESVLAQDYSNVEYIIIDGASTDGTLPVINQYKPHINLLISEPDNGIYDAMNKGINFATGDVIGTLNADDVFAGIDVLTRIASAFKQQNADIVYGNLEYVNPQGGIIRRWYSGRYKKGAFNFGWMPPHPTFYCKKVLFDRFGLYKLQYGTAADYELTLRFMHLNKLNVYFLNKTMVKMNVGGVSNKIFQNRIKAWKNDFSAMGNNGVLFPLAAIFFKPLRKLKQYF